MRQPPAHPRRPARLTGAALGLLLAGSAACGPEGLMPEGAEDARLRPASGRAVAALPQAQVTSLRDGLPRMIEGDLGTLDPVQPGPTPPEGVAAAFGVTPAQLALETVTRDALGQTHLRYRQVVDGRPVVGAGLVLHAEPDGRLHAAGGALQPTDGLPAEAALTAEEAADTVGRPGATVGAPRLVALASQVTGALHLAWEVPVLELDALPPRHDLLYVDAVDGRRLDADPQIHTALERAIHDDQHRGSYWALPGVLRRSEGEPYHGDVSVDAAYAHLGTTWGCLRELFGRDSYDGRGGTLRATVHFGPNYGNAAWYGDGLILGDGDGFQTGDMAQTFDVIAHEVGHGVTDRTANLLYQLESGALNESYSDVLAAACEGWRGAPDPAVWVLGEDVELQSWGLRRMDSPTEDGRSYDYYPERYVTSRSPSEWNDWGGVHTNSGIGNLAFHLLAEGGTHPRGKTTVEVPALGLATAARIFHRALDTYLVSSSSFEDARAATVRAARDLQGAPAAEATALAWDAVGVPDGGAGAGAVRLLNGVAVDAAASMTAGAALFYLELPAGATDVRVETAGVEGDADLYARYGLVAAVDAWDEASRRPGSEERLDLVPATPGRWFVLVRASEVTPGLTVTASWTPPTLTAPLEPSLPPPPPTL